MYTHTVCICIYAYVYIYVYIYIYREREPVGHVADVVAAGVSLVVARVAYYHQY